MASVTDICNRALQKLGASRINNINDGNSVTARACLAAYYAVRDAEFRKHPWNFAIQRFALPANVPAPAFGPTTSCTLPTGWAKLLPPDPLQNSLTRDWTIEGNNLLTYFQAPVNVRCVMKVEDTSLYDPLFCEALSAKLAYELCETITQSNTKKQACADDYKAAIAEARKANAIEKVPATTVDDNYINARA